MLVREYMTRNPVTILADASAPVALRLMHDKKVRRLPVLDGNGKLVGIVSEKDLLSALPSSATTLAAWELPELMEKIKVEKVMRREVITVDEDTPLEEAARIMADHKIGSLPIMQGEMMAGIITETDLFKTLLQLMGGRRSGVRLTILVPDAKGGLAKVTNAVFAAGGDIVGLAINEISSATGMQWEITLKVQDVPLDKLVEAVRPVSSKIKDVREVLSANV